MKHNQETVTKLRKEAKELRKKLSDSLSVSNSPESKHQYVDGFP
jgi:hypothetical protein